MVFFILFIATIGVAMGMTPLIGELYVQGDRKRSSALLQNGMVFYLLLGIMITVLQYATTPLLYHLGQPEEIVDMAIPYYRMLSLSMPFMMIFFSFKQFLEGVGNTRAELYVTIVANICNCLLNWVFIYGHLGFAEMGTEGAGLATLVARISAPILIFIYFVYYPCYRKYLRDFSMRHFSRQSVRHLLQIGLPISMQMFLESSAFVGIGIMMGWFGKEAMSANQISNTLGNCAFMIVISIGAATTIRVSHCFGRRDIGQLALAAKASYHLVLVWNTFTALFFHHSAPYHPDHIYHQRRGHRHSFRPSHLRVALSALGRSAKRFGRYTPRPSGCQDHHAYRFYFLLAAQPPFRLSAGIHSRHGPVGSLPQFLFRTDGGGPAHDTPHPSRHTPPQP